MRLDPPTIQTGASGDAVRMLQRLLKNFGLNPGQVDGEVGPKTEAAVKEFQDPRPDLSGRGGRARDLGLARKLSRASARTAT